MKISSKILALVVVVILFGSIGFTTVLGWWQTESSKEPARFTTGELAGQYNPADIRGSYTFGDIERSFKVPAAVLAEAFAVADEGNPADFQLKDLETIYAGLAEEGYEIGTDSVRVFTAMYTGLPYVFNGDVYLPEPAADLLLEQGGLNGEQVDYLKTHTVSLASLPAGASQAVEPEAQPATPVSPAAAATPQPETHVETDRVIKGKTSFAEVLEWGVPQEKIEAVIGGPLPNPLTLIKDYCLEKGLEFSDIKTRLQAEVDKAP